jgi:hypothetical protein
MDENYITRGELYHLLLKWQSGELNAQDVWDWASHHYLPEVTQYDDWEEQTSVAQELLMWLDSLDLNLVLVEDVDMHLAFLGTPLGAFQDGYRSWREAHAAIDYVARRLQLRDHPIYGPYCQTAIEE